MPNRLSTEPSPYLLQHKDNPVDWYPWGEEAFAQARREDRPIFLSVGYGTCKRWQVVEVESFVCPLVDDAFTAVGAYYDEFGAVADAGVIATLAHAASGRSPGP